MAPAGYGGPLLLPSLSSLALSLALWTDHLPVTFVAVCCAAPAFQSCRRLSFQFVTHRAVLRPRSVSQRGFQARERRSFGASGRRSAKDRSGSGWHGGKRRTRTRWWWRVARRTPLELQLDQLVKFLGGFFRKGLVSCGSSMSMAAMEREICARGSYPCSRLLCGTSECTCQLALTGASS